MQACCKRVAVPSNPNTGMAYPISTKVLVLPRAHLQTSISQSPPSQGHASARSRQTCRRLGTPRALAHNSFLAAQVLGREGNRTWLLVPCARQRCMETPWRNFPQMDGSTHEVDQGWAAASEPLGIQRCIATTANELATQSHSQHTWHNLTLDMAGHSGRSIKIVHRHWPSTISGNHPGQLHVLGTPSSHLVPTLCSTDRHQPAGKMESPTYSRTMLPWTTSEGPDSLVPTFPTFTQWGNCLCHAAIYFVDDAAVAFVVSIGQTLRRPQQKKKIYIYICIYIYIYYVCVCVPLHKSHYKSHQKPYFHPVRSIRLDHAGPIAWAAWRKLPRMWWQQISRLGMAGRSHWWMVDEWFIGLI